VLSRTNLAHFSCNSSLNLRRFNNLQPLALLQKSQILCNQANPASFSKTPGVGVSRRDTRPLDFPTFRRSDDQSSLLPITSLQILYFHAIPHSLAQRRQPIRRSFNHLRTLLPLTVNTFCTHASLCLHNALCLGACPSGRAGLCGHQILPPTRHDFIGSVKCQP
jgi:hypothetical protein